MHKLGEQWVEIIDGEKHMVKCVVDNGMKQIIYSKKEGEKVWLEEDLVNLSLGVLNDEGILPEERTGIYPEIEKNEDGYYILFIQPHLQIYVGGYKTKEQLIEAWNRRV